MKQNILLAAVAAASFLSYFLLKKKSGNTPNLGTVESDHHKRHHLTEAFANAKKGMLNTPD